MDRDSLVYKAKLAEQAERFDEMVADMKEVAKQPQELTVEERNLLSVAYKNVIGSRRASWRVVTSIEQKGDADKMTIIKDYKAKIETELVDICNDILNIIEDSLIPNSTSEEAKVFYYKMKGDYFRYIAEFTEGEGKTGAANSAHDACALFGISEAARLVCGDSSNILHSKANEMCFRTSDCPICMDVCLAVFRRN